MTRVRWFMVFALALFALALPATAWAADSTTCTYPGTTCPSTSVAPENVSSAPSNVLGTNAANNGSSSLPFTGGDIAGLTAIGGGAILVGVVLARARRADSRS